MWAKDSQKIKKRQRFPGSLIKDGIPKKQRSGPVEHKREEKTPVSSSKVLSGFSFLYI